jgi:hypothetical protein
VRRVRGRSPGWCGAFRRPVVTNRAAIIYRHYLPLVLRWLLPLPAWQGGWRGTVTFRQDIGQAGEQALTVGSFRLPRTR